MSSIINRILPTPNDLEARYPLPTACEQFVHESRQRSARILKGEEKKIAILMGPCSIHNRAEAIEYGLRLKQLQEQVESQFFLIMRVFLEKPRSRLGWKGMIYDPYLDGSNDLEQGLIEARSLLLELNELQIPCSTEFLEPLISVYLSDLITWGMIGARTAASQPHRQLASGLPFPVGFKNGVYGELETALSGVVTARTPHTHFSLNPEGKIASVQTTGNPLAHLVLRGSEIAPNCDPASVQRALLSLRDYHIEERIGIDCAHGNSGKELARQKEAFLSAIDQIKQGNRAIRALMLESYLEPGKQPLGREADLLQYGISITDPCIGWEETQNLLFWAAEELSSSINFVQK